MPHPPQVWLVGSFGGTPRSLHFAKSPGPLPASSTTLVRMPHVPQLLVDITGHCIYASQALADMLQCGLHELYGDGWRPRLSPYGGGPFNLDKALEVAKAKQPIRLHSPDGRSAFVTRIRAVTDPDDPEKVTGFFGRVQLVRVHRKLVETGVAAITAALIA
jgi:PAS domain-containing protein